MTRKKTCRLLLSGLVPVLVLTLCCLLGGALAASPAWAAKHKADQDKKEDDWCFEEEFAKVQKEHNRGGVALGGGKMRKFAGRPAPTAMMSPAAPSLEMANRLGLAVGGAKDIANFRENIARDLLPLPTDVTPEGLFYDYYFAIDADCPGKELFCPTFTPAVSDDPFTKKPEPYLSVGLGSGLDAADFTRKKLDLMLVLDISGSMSAPFDAYYYDHLHKKGAPPPSETERRRSKMDAAKDALIALLDHLKPDDRFGLVLFNQFAYTALVLRPVAQRDMEAIKGHIRALHPMGGTNLDAGLALATSLMQSARHADPAKRENRVVFMTDAMPNLGSTSDTAFLARIRDNAAIRLYSTVIGIGLDFNTELVEKITKARGANYYSVHTPGEFRKRLDTEFDAMVTPLVFDLVLDFKSTGYAIDKVYGSPEADAATGELMRVSTLFPSPTTEEGTRGGLVLLRLRRTGDSAAITLTASYEDRAGKRHATARTLDFPAGNDVPGTPSVRKGILLARYVSLLRDWIIAARTATGAPTKPEPIRPGQPGMRQLGQWERQSRKLLVSPEQRARFAAFRSYFQQEMPTCDDASLARELPVLDTLAGVGTTG